MSNREVQRVSCPVCDRFIGFIITEKGHTTGPEFTHGDTEGCKGCLGMVRELERFMPVERPTSPGATHIGLTPRQAAKLKG
jgi:hypothetical protein